MKSKTILAYTSLMSLLLFFAASPCALAGRGMPKIKGRVLPVTGEAAADGWGEDESTTTATAFDVTNTLLNPDGTFSYDTFNQLKSARVNALIPNPENREVLYYLASIWESGKEAGNADVVAPLGALGALILSTNTNDDGNKLAVPVSALGNELKNLHDEVQSVNSYVQEQQPKTAADLEFFNKELVGAEEGIASILNAIGNHLTSLVALSGTLSNPDTVASINDVDRWVAMAIEVQASKDTQSASDSPLSGWQKFVGSVKSFIGFGDSVVVPQNPSYVSLLELGANQDASSTSDSTEESGGYKVDFNPFDPMEVLPVDPRYVYQGGQGEAGDSTSTSDFDVGSINSAGEEGGGGGEGKRK